MKRNRKEMKGRLLPVEMLGGHDAGAPASATDAGDARQLLRVTSDRRGWPD